MAKQKTVTRVERTDASMMPDEEGVFTFNDAVYYFTGVINVLLLLRLILKVFGANVVSPFVRMIYGVTQVFLAPFSGIFDVAAAGESVFEPAILVAILIYTLLAKAIVELTLLLTNADSE